MSDYPKVYGHCDAGCKREVPSREEYEATLIRIVDKHGNPYKEIVLEIDEDTGEMNVKLILADTATSTE
jgi:hypothetical protein